MLDSDVLRLAHAELIPWLHQAGLHDLSIKETIDGHCGRLVTLGVPLRRMVLGHLLLHPLYADTDYTWNAASGDTVRSYTSRDAMMSETYRNSPFHYAAANGLEFTRYPLKDGTCEPEFPIFSQLRDNGVTDYCVSFQSGLPPPMRSLDGRPAGVRYLEGVVSSFATGRISGFSSADLGLIQATAPAVALVVKAKSAQELSAVMLDTYLGAYSGKRVLEGLTARGDYDLISCIVWLCDLRHSTRLADTMPLNAYLELLNDYFECAASAVIEHGGEVLKFIGDAVMAIFPIDTALRRPPEMARAALAAASESLARSRERSQERQERGEPRIDIGITLYVGEVAYGNVGLPRRLDFTVIGPSVNVVTRLQEVCKSLSTPIIASAEFAGTCELELVPLGEQSLAGVEGNVGVFTLPELRDD